MARCAYSYEEMESPPPPPKNDWRLDTVGDLIDALEKHPRGAKLRIIAGAGVLAAVGSLLVANGRVIVRRALAPEKQPSKTKGRRR